MSAPVEPELESTMTGAELVAWIVEAQTGMADVQANDLIVTGTVDLRAIRVVDRPLRCVSCRFSGDVLASDVEFRGVVELVDTVFEGQVATRGATFERSAVFDGSEFESSVDMSSARFEALASFARTDFVGSTSFDRARFVERADFTGGAVDALRADSVRCSGKASFRETATFTGTSFGQLASFRQRCFVGRTDFSRSLFEANADFALVEHRGEATYRLANFASATEFTAATFRSDVTFEGATVAGDMHFEGASFDASTTFSSMSGSGLLTLDGALLSDDASVRMAGFALSRLSARLRMVNAIVGPDNQKAALELLETTARDEGRNAFANDVRYELLDRRSTEYSQPERFAYQALYGSMAGFLLQPIRPILWALALTAAGALVRARPWFRPIFDCTTRRVPVLRQFTVGFLWGLSRTVAATWNLSRPPALVGDSTSSGSYLSFALRWTEWLAIKALIAAALLGVANANPTIRELVDSVF